MQILIIRGIKIKNLKKLPWVLLELSKESLIVLNNHLLLSVLLIIKPQNDRMYSYKIIVLNQDIII